MKAQRYFIGQFKKVWYQWHMRAAKEQARQHIHAASPEPLQITLKRRNVYEGLCQISFASSRKFGTNHICGQRISKTEGMWIKALAKILGTVHEKYHICEQRMIWRGCIAQSRQSLR